VVAPEWSSQETAATAAEAILRHAGGERLSSAWVPGIHDEVRGRMDACLRGESGHGELH
jgi:hypothetical protein